VLVNAGVMADQIVIDSAASNSFQEARATLALLQGRGWEKSPGGQRSAAHAATGLGVG
jgi:hypothetical protein